MVFPLPFNNSVLVEGVKLPLLVQLPFRDRVFAPASRLAPVPMVISPPTVVDPASVLVPLLLSDKLPYVVAATDCADAPL